MTISWLPLVYCRSEKLKMNLCVVATWWFAGPACVALTVSPLWEIGRFTEEPSALCLSRNWPTVQYVAKNWLVVSSESWCQQMFSFIGLGSWQLRESSYKSNSKVTIWGPLKAFVCPFIELCFFLKGNLKLNKQVLILWLEIQQKCPSGLDFILLCCNYQFNCHFYLFSWQASSLHQKLHPHAPVCVLHVTSSQHLFEGQSRPFQCWIAGLWLCPVGELKNS